MKRHTKLYFDYFRCHGERILCECCENAEAVDIHHISNKGMGGSKTKDYIENLIALCRMCHDKAHKEIIKKDRLSEIHLGHLSEFKGMG
jgi:5-methylcytosine-specific restriction endonuclease McrA